jgi:hypothetical protein
MIADMGFHEDVEAMLEKHQYDPEMLSKVICLYRNKKVRTNFSGLSIFIFNILTNSLLYLLANLSWRIRPISF